MNETIDAVAARAATDPAGTLSDVPWLGTAIDADAAAGRFDGWGASTVVDENVGAPVMPESLFDALHDRAGLAGRWPVGNAGLLHVYGYLLSTVPTPYGLKRERWLSGALARAYGLAADAFVPWTSSRTLLERVMEASGNLRRTATVRTAVVDGTETTVAIGRVPADGPWALAYFVGTRLGTTFAVGSPEDVLDPWDAEPPRLRWNAVHASGLGGS